jgi:chromosome segregation ATPase
MAYFKGTAAEREARAAERKYKNTAKRPRLTSDDPAIQAELTWLYDRRNALNKKVTELQNRRYPRDAEIRTLRENLEQKTQEAAMLRASLKDPQYVPGLIDEVVNLRLAMDRARREKAEAYEAYQSVCREYQALAAQARLR